MPPCFIYFRQYGPVPNGAFRQCPCPLGRTSVESGGTPTHGFFPAYWCCIRNLLARLSHIVVTDCLQQRRTLKCMGFVVPCTQWNLRRQGRRPRLSGAARSTSPATWQCHNGAIIRPPVMFNGCASVRDPPSMQSLIFG